MEMEETERHEDGGLQATERNWQAVMRRLQRRKKLASSRERTAEKELMWCWMATKPSHRPLVSS